VENEPSRGRILVGSSVTFFFVLFFFSQGNRDYLIQLRSSVFPIYCHMTNDLGACGEGGWTLVMKIDGYQVPLIKNLRRILELHTVPVKTFRSEKKSLNAEKLTDTYAISLLQSQSFTTTQTCGATSKSLTLREGRLGSTHKRQSYRPTGWHPLLRFASVWRSASRSILLS